MAKDMKPIDLSQIKTFDLTERHSKVAAAAVGRPWRTGGRLWEFLDTLPDILAGRDFRAVVAALARARREGRPVLLGMGAHVIKVGLSPVVAELLREGFIGGLAVNGACLVHDSELAMIGRTSEEVEDEIKTGRFGMARQTGRDINRAINAGVSSGLGLGSAVGKWIFEGDLPHKHLSLLAAAHQSGVTTTAHVAMGTDIIHMHPDVDPALTGLGSHRDFLSFTGLVAGLEGGVYINLGSAVVLPEVFLKAVTLARNLGHRVERITTVNMDFLRQYRPLTNVVHRPTTLGGQGFSLTGHHEIMFPLLVAAWKEAVA